MTDIVERLRLLESGARWMCAETADTLEDAADEIERLRAECQRLAGEVSRAHKDALTWMGRAAAARREAIEAALNACLRREHFHTVDDYDGVNDDLRADGARGCIAALRALLEEGR